MLFGMPTAEEREHILNSIALPANVLRHKVKFRRAEYASIVMLFEDRIEWCYLDMVTDDLFSPSGTPIAVNVRG